MKSYLNLWLFKYFQITSQVLFKVALDNYENANVRQNHILENLLENHGFRKALIYCGVDIVRGGPKFVDFVGHLNLHPHEHAFISI
jgi:hypothetical protein